MGGWVCERVGECARGCEGAWMCERVGECARGCVDAWVRERVVSKGGEAEAYITTFYTKTFMVKYGSSPS